MKLASLKHGRDGELVVVSRDLTRYARVSHIATHYSKPWIVGGKRRRGWQKSMTF